MGSTKPRGSWQDQPTPTAQSPAVPARPRLCHTSLPAPALQMGPRHSPETSSLFLSCFTQQSGAGWRLGGGAGTATGGRYWSSMEKVKGFSL